MELKDEKEKSKMNIKKELISEDLSELLKVLIVFLLLAGVFGYIGYIYSKDNNVSVGHGVIFGILFPLGVGLLELLDCDGFISFIIYTLAYLMIASYIPTWVGGIILFIIIAVFILNFIYIEKKDRTEEIEKYYNRKEKKITTVQNNKHPLEDVIMENVIEDTDKDDFKEIEEEFECERCFKKISEEEYELYDCMCEDCFMDVHIDKDGNYHEDEFFDV